MEEKQEKEKEEGEEEEVDCTSQGSRSSLLTVYLFVCFLKKITLR